MGEATNRDTKDRILDAAESLFADRGFAATSLRMITTEAAVNLAAVNYHFGSKESLIDAVFERRVHPLNRERLRRLDILEAAETPLTVEAVVQAFVEPALQMTDDPVSRSAVRRLMGHAMSRPEVYRMFVEHFREVFRRYSGALAELVPHLKIEELVWRFKFMVGAMAHTMAMSEEIEQISDGMSGRFDVDVTVSRLVQFVSHGLLAPAAAAHTRQPTEERR